MISSNLIQFVTRCGPLTRIEGTITRSCEDITILACDTLSNRNDNGVMVAIQEECMISRTFDRERITRYAVLSDRQELVRFDLLVAFAELGAVRIVSHQPN
jgi:hypothetical protein